MCRFKKWIIAIVGLIGILTAGAAQAYIIPVASVYEINGPDWQLFLEAELTRWKQEALKYREMAYTDTLGRIGGPVLNDGGILSQMQGAATDSSNLIEQTIVPIPYVSDLGTYSEATQKQIEDNLMLPARKGLSFTSAQIDEIAEKQRVVINDWAEGGIAMATAVVADTTDTAVASLPETRGGQLASAQDLSSMFEMMLRMDRQIYERSLQLSAIEATDAGVTALQLLQGLSRTTSALKGEEAGS